MYCVRFAILFLLCLPATGCQPIPEAVLYMIGLNYM